MGRRKFSDSKTVRDKSLTISVSHYERSEIVARAKSADESIPDFIIGRTLGANFEPLAFGPNGEASFSLRAAAGALTSNSLPKKYFDKLPLAIQEAIGDYQSAAQRGGEDFKNAINRDDYISKELAYSDDTAATIFQGELRDALRSIHDLGSIASAIERNNVERHFARVGLFPSQRILFLYTFYRSPARRPFWGVIPYGTHTRTGLLVHRSIMRELPSGGLQKGASSAGWLGGVINKLCAASNKLKMLGFAEGFFEEEISEIIWAKAQSDHRLDYENHRKPLSFELLGLKTPTKKLLEHLTKNSVGLLVFDLGFAAKIKPLINDQSEWQVVEFPHEADFPVGVGFSHSFLPRLLVHDNWKKIGSSVFKNIEPTKAGLKASGISPLEENIYL